MHVHPISTFRLFQEGHLLRNSIAIFALTTLFYFIGAELRLVHELSLFWPLNGVMAGVFARYVWLNRLHYYAISYVAMLVYDAITTEWAGFTGYQFLQYDVYCYRRPYWSCGISVWGKISMSQ